MVYLSNDPRYIWKQTGFDALEHSLPPKLAVDGYRASIPLLALSDDRGPLIFLREIDRTNVERLRHPGATFVWYAPYFTFGGMAEHDEVYPDLLAAIREQLIDEPTLDPRMPFELHRALQEGADGVPGPPIRFHPPTHHYVVSSKEVDLAFAGGRTELKEAAEPFVSDLNADPLAPWLARQPEDRFAQLDRLLEAAGLNALLVASPLSIQDLTGLPMRVIGEGSWAIYPAGSPVVHLLSQHELPFLDLPLAQKAEIQFVRELARGARVGFEEVALSYAAWLEFGLDELEAEPATSLLRRWRELRGWEDLAAYVIGARVTLEAIDGAIAFVEAELGAGRPVTELNAYERYRSRVGAFIRKHQLPIRVRTYFTHTHAGDRSHFPASATAHFVTSDSSLKIDGGLEIYDSKGMFLGVSDITRSAVASQRAKAFYTLLDRALLEGAIAACRSGVKGSEIFAAGLRFLEPYRGDVIDAGFMPGSDLPMEDLFTRNIGHLIGKQEPATVEFKSSDHGTVEPGMIAAAEFQWPYSKYCIGVEDVVLITDDGPINLTRPM
jgi:Xaa-Pro aminopeptidase